MLLASGVFLVSLNCTAVFCICIALMGHKKHRIQNQKHRSVTPKPKKRVCFVHWVHLVMDDSNINNLCLLQLNLSFQQEFACFILSHVNPEEECIYSAMLLRNENSSFMMIQKYPYLSIRANRTISLLLLLLKSLIFSNIFQAASVGFYECCFTNF